MSIIKDTMNDCKDCKYVKKTGPPGSRYKFAVCTRPHNRKAWVGEMFISLERDDEFEFEENHCGTHGIYFEKKKTKWERIKAFFYRIYHCKSCVGTVLGNVIRH